jgi:putative ABC transport system permease protein
MRSRCSASPRCSAGPDAGDDRRGGGPDGPVAVISYGFWQRRFGGAVDAIGKRLTIERVPFTIVGITAPSFFGLHVGASFDVVVPFETEPLLGRPSKRLTSSTWTWMHVMARVAPGQTAESLTVGLGAAQPKIREATMPAFTHAEDRERYFRAGWMARPAPGGVSPLRRQYGPALVTLLAVVGLVLLAACANIATLMLSRSAGRRHECTIRVALGASRGRLMRQMLIESLLLSAIGAAAGFALARWGGRLLVAQLSTWASTAVLDLSFDWRVLAVTVATTVTTALLFGTVPAFWSSRVRPSDALTPRARGVASNTTRGVGGGLVIVQVALSLVLVVGAGLFLRSFAALAYRDLGFDRNRVLVAVVDARHSAIPAAGRAALYERLRTAVAAVAGVESAAISLATPLGNAGVRFTPDIVVPGDGGSARQPVRILTTPVSPDWFRTFGTQILAGRDFTPDDRFGGPTVAVVNLAFARRYFNGAAPLGQTLVEVAGPADRRPLEIVGLVEDAAFATVRDVIEPTIYKPLAQRLDERLMTAIPSISVSVRALEGVSPSGLSAGVATAIGNVDRDLTVVIRTVTEQLGAHYVRERLLALLSGFFGMLALLLAAIGLYGLTAYSVSVRRTEIGIRMALGADRGGVVRIVLGRIAWRAAAGIVLGALVSFWAAGFVRTLLFGLDAHDPLTFVAAALVMAGVAGVSGWLPARRAARTDAATVLREG